MNNWNDLLINLKAFDKLSPEQLSAAKSAAECNTMTLDHGIAAIGNALAIAALNEDVGLSLGAVADLGWLIESLSKLNASITDRGNMARSYANRPRSNATKHEV
jgi:hypothetical protein